MYQGFDVNITQGVLNSSKDTAKEMFDSFDKTIKKSLDEYIGDDGILSGEKMQKDWFPEIKADIFISHAHKDESEVLALAGWLYNEFKLTSFVDSRIWGYAPALLRTIDNRYCKYTDDKGKSWYNYDRRNGSTAHIYMMLSAALIKMIDNSECLFFLNTPNSINASNSIEELTFSPWIYGEILYSRLIKRSMPDRLNQETRTFSKGGPVNLGLNEQLNIKYPVDKKHLKKLNIGILQNWYLRHDQEKDNHPLDTLYSIYEDLETSIIKG